MRSCSTCDMPLNEVNGMGTDTVHGPICQHCLGPDGQPHSCEFIFKGGVEFFLTIEGVDSREFSEQLTRKNMNRLAYWQKHPHPLLEGEECSDEDYAAVCARL